jgi:regulator of protease activity HflC (stomatin/prohibitin superfamily)
MDKGCMAGKITRARQARPYRQLQSGYRLAEAEAERTRRAKIINAEGEQQAAQKLVDAAQILAPVPQGMQLRYLATLFDIAGERSSTIVFPFPINLMQAWASHGSAERG